MGPEKPGHIKTVLSSPLPISLDYHGEYDWEGIKDITGSALWRMRAALKHPDRVREIRFEGDWPSLDKFFKMTNCPFPMLESLHLGIFFPKPNIPATFLRGPDLSDLHHLRRLTVHCATFASIFDFLSSATAVTDLTLVIDTPFGPTPETSLHACLQVMPGLLNLDLTLLCYPEDYSSEPFIPEEASMTSYRTEDVVTLSSPKEVVEHSKVKRLRFYGDPSVVKAFVRWFRAPSVEDCKYGRHPPIPLRFRTDNDVEEHFDTA